MHELGIATDLLAMVEEQAERSGMGTVVRVVIELGVLAPIDAEALGLAFEIARGEGAARAAELVIDRVAAEATCRDCGAISVTNDALSLCPSCQGPRLTLRGGRTLQLIAIEGT
jgi:hydrogenase nickel incorporation protein HypA/HybF